MLLQRLHGLGEAEGGGCKSFFCKIAKRALTYVANKIANTSISGAPSINDIFPAWVSRQMASLQEWTSSWNFRVASGASDDGPASLPMTMQEEKQLDTWFSTFIDPLTQLITNNLIALQNATTEQKTQGYNSALQTMCLLLAHASQPTNGLSQNAITNRVNALNFVFDPFRKIIFSQAVGWKINNVSISLNQLQASAYGLSPMSGNANCQLVELAVKTIGTAKNDDLFIDNTGQIKSVKDDVNLDFSSNQMLVAKPTNTASQTSTNNTTEKTSFLKPLAWIAGFFLVWRVATKDSK